jgi:hypothetical protein
VNPGTNRGDRREPVFRDDEDRRRFLETIGEVRAAALRWISDRRL